MSHNKYRNMPLTNAEEAARSARERVAGRSTVSAAAVSPQTKKPGFVERLAKVVAGGQAVGAERQQEAPQEAAMTSEAQGYKQIGDAGAAIATEHMARRKKKTATKPKKSSLY